MFRPFTRLCGVAALAFFAVLAHAQNNNGRISGTVTDSTGSVIAGAKVTVTNASTNVSRGRDHELKRLLHGAGPASRDLQRHGGGHRLQKAEKKGYDLVDHGAHHRRFQAGSRRRHRTITVTEVSGESVNTVSGELRAPSIRSRCRIWRSTAATICSWSR